MTAEEANAINLEEEINIITLRELVKFWQEKAFQAEVQIAFIRRNIPEE